MTRVIVWIIQGFDVLSKEGRLENVVTFEVYAESEKEALKRAKELVKKKLYRIQRVIEKEE